MFPTKRDTGCLRVPVVSFTGRDHALAVVLLPPKNSENTSVFFRILGFTVPTRIKSLLAPTPRPRTLFTGRDHALAVVLLLNEPGKYLGIFRALCLPHLLR